MSNRNAPPANIWEALRRLLNCNKSQLAERLNVTPRTLARWEAGEPGPWAEVKAHQLVTEIFAAIEAERPDSS